MHKHGFLGGQEDVAEEEDQAGGPEQDWESNRVADVQVVLDTMQVHRGRSKQQNVKP